MLEDLLDTTPSAREGAHKAHKSLTGLTFSVLSTTYIATSRLSTACYGQHMLLYLVLSQCAIATYRFISLNFAGLLLIKHRGKDFYTAFDGVTW